MNNQCRIIYETEGQRDKDAPEVAIRKRQLFPNGSTDFNILGLCLLQKGRCWIHSVINPQCLGKPPRSYAYFQVRTGISMKKRLEAVHFHGKDCFTCLGIVPGVIFIRMAVKDLVWHYETYIE